MALPGQKRKRVETKNSKPAPHKPAAVSAEDSVRGKLHHGIREVKSVAKKAKDFEIRRAIKRLKNEKKKTPSGSKDVENAESELELLKHINHEYIALHSLQTKLHKSPISKDPVVQSALSSISFPSSSSSPLLRDFTYSPGDEPVVKRVESRLLSSKVLADGVKAVLETLRVAVQPYPESGDVDTYGDEIASALDDDDGDDPPIERNEPNLQPVDSDSDTDSDAHADAAGWESGSVASSSSSSSSTSRAPKRSRITQAQPIAPPSDSEDDGSDSDSSEGIDPDALDDSEDEDEREERDGNHFLPSLQVGYTRGDDGASDADSASDNGASGGHVRKNRRGQRARKAIWEKKYGKNANHVKKQREEDRARDEARALAAKAKAQQRLAEAEGGQSGGGRGRGRGIAPSGGSIGIPARLDGGWKGGAENRNRPPPASSNPRGRGTGTSSSGTTGRAAAAPKEEKLHPSWEAKRRMKEKEQIGIVPSQGRRIKF